MLVAKFSVAVTTAINGQPSKTTWFQCVALRDCAEELRDHFSQGDAIYVEGSVEPYEYALRGSRQKVASVRVLVDRVKKVSTSKRAEEWKAAVPPIAGTA
jgi:single-stranded DNA-binding protein